MNCYAAKTLNENIRFQSTSGGMFTELALEVMKGKYQVAGARYSQDYFSVYHDVINKIEDIPLLRQSKYVESSMSGIRDKIKNGETMFVGTPCQCASIKADIKIDFICRGVPMLKAYQSYLNMLENQYESKINRIWFKHKGDGWDKINTRIWFENGKVYMKGRTDDLYMLGYLRHNLLMQNRCYKCKFKGFPRYSDITIADFWGYPGHDNKGLSAVIVNTPQGQSLFDNLNLWKKTVKIEDIQKKNPCLAVSPKKGLKAEKFIELLDSFNFDECFRRVTNV